MIVYVIDKQKLISYTLPSRISGSYWIMDVDEYNQEKNIINIAEESGKWVAYSNKNVGIIINDQAIDKVILEEHKFFLLKLKNQQGYLILYASPVNDKTNKRFTIDQNTEITIGSNPNNTISYRNQLISPQHLNLKYQQGIWLLEDLNSQNGTFVNNKVIKGIIRLNHGDVIFVMGLKLIILGNTLVINNPLNQVTYDRRILKELNNETQTLQITTSEEDLEENLYNENDYFIRLPRFMETIDNTNFKIEGHPTIDEPETLPLLITIGPMFTMGSTAFVMLLVSFISYQSGNRDFVSILPTMAISISMLAGTLLWPTLNRSFQKKQQQKKKAKIEKRYNEYLVKKEQELRTIIETQKQILLSNNISPVECYNLIVNKNRRLWERELQQKDFLTLRLGIGKAKIKINLDYPAEHFKVDEDLLDEKLRLIIDRNKEIEGAPIVASFIEKNITAIIGKYEHIKPFVDLLILQMVALHSYHDLKIVIMTNNGREKYWEYMKLMPHSFSSDRTIRFFSVDFDESKEISSYLQKVLNARKDSKIVVNKEESYKNFDNYYIIITDDYKMAKENPIIDEILNQEVNLGFSLLILNDSLSNIPTQCKSFINISDAESGGIFENEISKETQNKFNIEYVDKLNLEHCALILANIPIKNKDENYELPKMISFLEMYKVGKVEQLNPLERWQVNNPIISLAVPIGITTSGKLFKLDLHEKEQGPHGLIAGMTGSGKSEFIITYILSMALNFHPDEVQFVLIDYKGGGLVGAFENKENGIKLPHLAGTITNLETADINRALASIESELKRRQALFNKARDKLGEGTIDIYKYQKYYREGQVDEPISHLFIISDEFAELKSQQPEFMDQLISTARIGRSLGVHLILATQKPSGVVNDQIWSNSRFKVCLKVQDESDSNEVIKRPDAASIRETGRFYLQVGYNELFSMGQAAWAGAPYYPQDKVYHEIDSSIEFINNVGRSIKTIDVPRKEGVELKGEQLPNIVKYLATLAAKENVTVRKLWLDQLPKIIYVDNLKKKYQFKKIPFNIQAIIGEYDNPKEQKQGLLTLDLMTKGNTAIYSMTEKNTITNTIIYSLITTYTTEELNIYIMDFDSETLKIYRNSPQVGDVVFINEKEKIEKLMKMLLEELEERKRIFQDYNGSYEFFSKHSEKKLPSIVTVLSGYENFKESYDALEQSLSKITREGQKYGIYTIVTAISDRSLRLSMRSNFPQILPLKMNSLVEYNMLLGKKCPTIKEIANRGIAIVNDNPYEFQTAVICENEKLQPYIKEVCDYLKKQLSKKAPPIPILPEKITIPMLLGNLTDISNVPIGIEEESLKVSTYNFKTNLFNLINSEDIDALTNFSSLLIKELSNLSNVKLVILDFKNLYDEKEIANKNIVCYKANNYNFEQLNNLIFAKDRKEELLIFITDIMKYIETLPLEVSNSFSKYLSSIQNLNNCHFAFVTDLFNIKKYSYEAWFRQNVNLDTGIWIGRGLNNSTIHNLSTSIRTLSFPLPPNFGYNIKKGVAIRIKLLEGDEDE